MTFAIDTGASAAPAPKSAMIDESQQIDPTNGLWMERAHRQIIEAIEACETQADLAEYMEGETLLLDSLYMHWPEFWARIDDAHDTQRALLQPRATPSAQADPNPAEPGNQPKPTNKETNMFDIDTAASTSGPFLNWKAQRKVFDLRRSADDITEFDGFANGGVILDIENIKVGWQYTSGVKGQAPDWKWWPAPNQRIEKPNDEYKWGISIPCAIGNGETAYWEQAGAAVQNAIQKLTPSLQSGEPGKLPLVRLTGTEDLSFTVGKTVIPILEVAGWRDRPDSLKSGIQAGIDTGAAQVAASAQAASAAAATATPAPDGGHF
ncbi:hypothetical protein AB3Y40_06695 [Yoonia sp. R2331]|uniref:hypothetical protein n=1 Tax=Yoonia sp. R2331 TaxID=3237238 RepID=UPI0034E56C4F